MFPELITELLQDGYKVNFSAPGHSMFPTIMANETILVEPIDPEAVRLADIILYRTNGQLIAHRVIRIEKEANTAIECDRSFLKRSAPQAQHSSNEVLLCHSASQDKCSSPEATAGSSTSETLQFVLRGDASRACDEPVKAGQILGKVISIERYGCSVEPYSFAHKLGCCVLFWMARAKRLPRLILSIFSSNGRQDLKI